MRFGVISDIHGNLHALQACLRVLRREGVDAWLSVGDLIGYGAHPNECVEMVAELGAIGVAGNHELVVLGTLAGTRSSARAKQTHSWTADVLRDDIRDYLRALPVLVQTHGIVLTHGSLGDPEAYVRSDAQAAQQLDDLARAHPDARMLLLGNTHRQCLHAARSGPVSVKPGGWTRLDGAQRHLLNPGSVGQSRQWEYPPAARMLLIDLDLSSCLFLRASYDVRANRRDIRIAGLPYRSMHSPPPLAPAVRRRLRRFRRG